MNFPAFLERARGVIIEWRLLDTRRLLEQIRYYGTNAGSHMIFLLVCTCAYHTNESLTLAKCSRWRVHLASPNLLPDEMHNKEKSLDTISKPKLLHVELHNFVNLRDLFSFNKQYC